MKAKQKQVKKPIKKTTTARPKAAKPVSSRSKTITATKSVKAAKITKAAKPTRSASVSKSTKPVKAARVVKPAAVKNAVKKTTAKRKQVNAKVRKQTKKVLIPAESNGYRPHLIRAHGIIAVLVIALLAQVAYGFITTGQFSILGRVSSIETADLLIETNREREVNGLSSLRIDDKLSQAAYLKAQDMFANDYWAHTSPSGVKPWKWFGDVDYNYSVAGENLAKNYPSTKTTVDAWMNSDSHRANILNGKYEDVGFAVVDGQLEGKNTTLVVALYGTPAVLAAQNEVIAPQLGFSAPVSGDSGGPFLYFGSAVQALSPVTIAVLGLLAIVAVVGVAAHNNRKRLPASWQRSWRKHHGMITFLGMIALGVLIILATGGGQI